MATSTDVLDFFYYYIYSTNIYSQHRANQLVISCFKTAEINVWRHRLMVNHLMVNRLMLAIATQNLVLHLVFLASPHGVSARLRRMVGGRTRQSRPLQLTASNMERRGSGEEVVREKVEEVRLVDAVDEARLAVFALLEARVAVMVAKGEYAGAAELQTQIDNARLRQQ